MMKYRFILWIISVFLVGNSWANNLNITNISATTNTITFDIAWENSWYVDRAPNNWDAVWVFVKAQDCNDPDRLWSHVDLSINPTHHTAAAPLVVDTVSDGKGVFIRRGALGSGNINATTVTLRLQNTYNLSNISFQVMGIEMVAVLDGDFSIGGYTGSETTGTQAGHSYPNVLISSEAQIDAGDIRTNGVGPTQYTWGYNPTIPASFPKGYNRFYIMKYEISQEQYVKFLNTLTFAQQTMRTEHTPASASLNNAFGSNNTTSSNRNGIKIVTPGNVANPAEYGMNLNNNSTFDELADGHNVACNFLNWTDLLAYLDWSALRPMTELEYEKACRGPFSIVDNEYAWGNASITSVNGSTLTPVGEPSEASTTTPSFGSGMAATGSAGPFRVGFAGTSTSGRISAGVSYWGVFDLTGNVWEQAVCTGYQNGNISGFTGSLGDGSLTVHGDANEPDWDLDPLKSIVRGGSWGVANTMYARVGSRFYMGSTSVTYNGPTRNASTGGRGVRQF